MCHDMLTTRGGGVFGVSGMECMWASALLAGGTAGVGVRGGGL